jgi:iron complex transport system substrate-binding protein
MLLMPSAARANSVTDAAERAIEIPETVKRVFPAGPAGCDHALHPGAGSLARVAPRQPSRGMRVHAAGYLRAPRGRVAAIALILNPFWRSNPIFIIDVGSTAPTFVSLATRVQTFWDRRIGPIADESVGRAPSIDQRYPVFF